MKFKTTLAIVTLIAALSIPRTAESQELTQRALKFLEGNWGGRIASEGDVSSRLGNIGMSKYSGTAKLATDNRTLLQIGGWSKVGVSGNVGWARYYKPGGEQDTVLIYVYSTSAHHAIVDAVVKPRGDFFEIVGKKSGVTPSRQLIASEFKLTVQDADHFTITNTARTEDGEAKPDEVLEYFRKKN